MKNTCDFKLDLEEFSWIPAKPIPTKHGILLSTIYSESHNVKIAEVYYNSRNKNTNIEQANTNAKILASAPRAIKSLKKLLELAELFELDKKDDAAHNKIMEAKTILQNIIE